MVDQPVVIGSRTTTDSLETDGGESAAVRFYVLAFASSWLVWGSAIVWSGLTDWEPLVIIAGAYGPLAAAVIVTRRTETTSVWLRQAIATRGRFRWILLGGLGLPLVIAGTHVMLYLLFDDAITLSSDPPWYWAVAVAPVNIWLLFWLGSAVEEFGWQGVGVPALAERLHPLAAAGLHGLLWGTWHLPLFLVDGWAGNDQRILILYGITVALSPTMMWLTRRAAGGVLPAVLLHSATNHYTALFTASGEDAVLFDPPLSGGFDAIKLAIYGVIAVIVIAQTGGRMAYVRASSRHWGA